LVKPFDDFLQLKNYPFKTMRQHLVETIQGITIPGLAAQTIAANALPNLRQVHHPPSNMDYLEGHTFPHTTVNKIFPGTSPLNEVLDNNYITITFKNSIFNWMYLYLAMQSYYQRTRKIGDFEINLDLFDSAQLPMLRFSMRYCFVSTIPSLEFSTNTNFNELKTFDANITFNKFDVEFLIPGFNSSILNMFEQEDIIDGNRL
jgi:hypothetical protein